MTATILPAIAQPRKMADKQTRRIFYDFQSQGYVAHQRTDPVLREA